MQDVLRLVLADADGAHVRHVEVLCAARADVMLESVCMDGREVPGMLDRLMPDVLLLSMTLPTWDGAYVIDQLCQRPLRRTPFVVMLSNLPPLHPLRADAVARRPLTAQSLQSALESVRALPYPAIAAPHMQSVRASAQHALMAMGIKPPLKGYDYLLEAICLTAADATLPHRMTTKLYPHLAHQFNTKHYCVERAMRHAIEQAWTHAPVDVLYGYFGASVDPQRGKPTNSECVAMLGERVRLLRTAPGQEGVEPHADT